MRTMYGLMPMLLAAGALALPACGDDDALPEGEFACGEGSCELAAEICIDVGGCTTCMDMPEACVGEVTCGCLLEQDHTGFQTYPCEAQGTCEESEAEGLVLSCTPDGWGCA